MTFKLTATISHKSFDQPIVHTFYYQGDTQDDILAQIETQPQHLKNLKHHGKAAFKDANGVKHQWVLEHMAHLN